MFLTFFSLQSFGEEMVKTYIIYDTPKKLKIIDPEMIFEIIPDDDINIKITDAGWKCGAGYKIRFSTNEMKNTGDTHYVITKITGNVNSCDGDIKNMGFPENAVIDFKEDGNFSIENLNSNMITIGGGTSLCLIDRFNIYYLPVDELPAEGEDIETAETEIKETESDSSNGNILILGAGIVILAVAVIFVARKKKKQ